VGSVARKADPELWEQVKGEMTAGDKGGHPGQWSARKAQLAVHEYKRRGGRYVGGRRADNNLSEWTREDWGTKSGGKSAETGERYLPKAAREHLSDEEYRRTTAKKRADAQKGRQFSAQPDDVARKTARYRGGKDDGATKAELMAEARRRDIRGRSKMSRDELARALDA
jgi:hypothetical protein